MIAPVIGHTGIVDSEKNSYDFAGYYVNVIILQH